jgi:DNA modification methylase
VSYRILEGDCLDVFATLEAGSVQTCITSPPYWGLRDYGNEGQLGLEPTPEQYVANMVEVFREVRRVLRDDGTLWLNLGDSYAANRSYQVSDGKHQAHDFGESNAQRVPDGLKPKDLVGIPWMVAFALRADGWYLRSDIIWAKPNPMPESVTDRPTKAHEFLFLLSKSPRYYYDADAIREEADCDRLRGPALHPDTVSTNGNDGLSRRPLDEESSSPVRKRRPPKVSGDRKELHGPTYSRHRVSVPGGQSLTGRSGRNKRSVWEVTTQPFPGAHFATFPPKLIEPCVLAGSAEGTTVLDPFAGAGTTGVVALRHNRDFIGIELNPEYAQMARNRIHDDAPLLNVEAA